MCGREDLFYVLVFAASAPDSAKQRLLRLSLAIFDLSVQVLSPQSHIDLSWNTIEPSLILMHEKLTDLDWVCYNGEIHIDEPEREESRQHI